MDVSGTKTITQDVLGGEMHLMERWARHPTLLLLQRGKSDTSFHTELSACFNLTYISFINLRRLKIINSVRISIGIVGEDLRRVSC